LNEKQLQVRLIGAGVWLILLPLIGSLFLLGGNSSAPTKNMDKLSITEDSLTVPLEQKKQVIPNTQNVQAAKQVAQIEHPITNTKQVRPPKKSLPAKKNIIKEKAPTWSESKSKKNRRSGWYVQLASFKTKKKSAALKSKLSIAGYSAIIKASNNKSSFRVRLGPYSSKKKASVAQNKFNKVKKKFGINNAGLLIRQP
jgi:cell division protein FtsN